MQTRRYNWRTEADLLLTRFESGEVAEKISIGMIANAVGVSRQTIWRNKEVMQRITSVKSALHRRPIHLTPLQKAEQTIEKLRAEIVRLEQDKSELTFRVVEIYTKLSNDGINPLNYIDEKLVSSE